MDAVGLNDQCRLSSFVEAKKELNKYGITRCYVDNVNYGLILDSISGLYNAKEVRDLLYGFLSCPYEKDLLEEDNEEYCNHLWKCGADHCIGLALAYICEGATFSFDTGKWNTIIILDKDGISFDVPNVYDQSSVIYYVDYFINDQKIELVESDLTTEEKISSISTRGDHGDDDVRRIARKMCKCKYVEGIINSAKFRPQQTGYISKISENGIVEMNFPWSDRGIGIVVQTTGRNKKETQAIAELLVDYCRTKY